MKIILVSQITIDGKLTVGTGKSSRPLIEELPKDYLTEIHRVRAENDGILIGANTARIDNPSLTNRYVEGKSPKRIIVSESLNFSFEETVFTDNNKTIVVTPSKHKNTQAALKIKEMGKKCIFVDDENFDMKNIVSILEKQEKIKKLIVEGGGRINACFSKHNLFDELLIYVVPFIVGGEKTPTLVDGNDTFLNNYTLVESEQKGNCIRLHYKRGKDEKTKSR